MDIVSPFDIHDAAAEAGMAFKNRNRHAEKLHIDAQKHATELVEYLTYQEAVAAGVQEQINLAGVNTSKIGHYTNPYMVAALQAHGSESTKKGGAWNRGQLHTRYTSDYEVTASNPIGIGEIDPAASDGRTYGFVEFFVQTGMQAEKLGSRAKRKALNSPQDGLPFRSTGEVVRCGARVLVGEKTGNHNDLVEVAVFDAILLPPIARQTIREIANKRLGTDEGSKELLRKAWAIQPPESAYDALDEIDRLLGRVETVNTLFTSTNEVKDTQVNSREKKRGRFANTVARGRIALHGAIASLNEDRVNWARSKSEKAKHAQLFYGELGSVALSHLNDDIPKGMNVRAQTFAERRDAKRLNKRLNKLYRQQTIQNALDAVFGDYEFQNLNVRSVDKKLEANKGKLAATGIYKQKRATARRGKAEQKARLLQPKVKARRQTQEKLREKLVNL